MPDSARQTPSVTASGAHEGILRSAGTVASLTLLSRLFGYLRDMIVAGLLGTSLTADAWQAAFQFPNTLRRLASEGNLSAAFVPVFAQTSRQRSDSEVWLLADRFHTAVLLVIAGLTGTGVVLAGWVVPLLFPGFQATPGKIELTVTLTRLVFVYALFISLNAVLMAVLNAREKFAAAAFTPVLLNLSIIAFGTIAWWRGSVGAVYYIVAGVLVGGACQWLFLVPHARRLGMRFRFLLGFGDPALREIGRLIVPRLFGVGIVQVNIVVGQLLATLLGGGTVAALYYSARVTELTLGVFAVAVATVVLPAMSRQGAAGDLAAMRSTLGFALRQVSAVTFPAAIGLILLRREIISALFERGQFGADSTALVAAGLGGYAVGLVGVAAVRITAPAFYALRETRTPVLVASVAMVVNVVGCVLLMGPLGITGIALANSVAASVNAALLLLLLRRRVGRLGLRAIARSMARIAVAATVMAAVTVGLKGVWLVGGSLGYRRVVPLAGTVAISALTYLAALAVLRAPELGELRGVFRGALPARLQTPAGSGDGPGDGR